MADGNERRLCFDMSAVTVEFVKSRAESLRVFRLFQFLQSFFVRFADLFVAQVRIGKILEFHLVAPLSDLQEIIDDDLRDLQTQDPDRKDRGT